MQGQQSRFVDYQCRKQSRRFAETRHPESKCLITTNIRKICQLRTPDIPPRLPVDAMAPIQLFSEELYVPRLNVSAEMGKGFPPIVILTLGIASQGTENTG